MTDHIDVPIVATGDWIDAAWINQYIGDNVRAWRQAYTATGMLAYALDGNTLAGLAKPASLGLLKNDAAGTPSWLTGGSAYQVLRKNAANNGFEFAGGGFVVASYNNATGHSYPTNVWRDMPNSSAAIVPLVTSTIVVFGNIINYGGGTYGERRFKFNIDGTDIDTHISHESYQINEWLTTPVFGIKTAVGAGSRTIKLREIADAGNFTVEQLAWIAIAIP